MRLEIRDLESSMVYDITSDGAVMGRERAKTDISFRDESISKRHARIYYDGGTWFLEDLGSSNGTYIDDQRVSGPVVLAQGAIFSLAQKRFEVVYADAGNGAALDDFPPLGVPSGRSAGDLPPPAGESMNGGRFDPDSIGGDEEVEGKGIGYFFVAVPKAIGYYLANVPLMAVNPLGTIRKGIEEQKLPAMGKMELIAYAVPAFVFTSLLGALMGVIVQGVAGNWGAAFVGLLTAWIWPLIAVVIAAFVGFIWHPVTRWVINFLKGESTAKSRTNYAIQAWTLQILVAIPQNIGIVLGLIPIPFIGVLPAILNVLVSVIFLVFATRWAKHFDLVKWAQTVILVLSVLGVVGSVAGVAGAFLNPGGATSAGGDMADAQEAAEEARKQAEAAMAAAKDANGDAADMQANAEKLAAMAAKNRNPEALAARDQAVEEAVKEKEEEAAEKEEEEEKEEENEETVARAPPPPPPARRAPPPPSRRAFAPAPAGSSGLSMAGPIEQDPLVAPKLSTAFNEYLRKREAIEAVISANPELVNRRDIRRHYDPLWEKTYKIRGQYSKKRGERWKKAKIYNRQKGQKIYEATREHVDRLYAILFN